MFVDLEEYRPKNETFEHFLLKQIGRAFLFEQGIRCIGTEVDIPGDDHPGFGESKKIIDVLGLVKRMRSEKAAQRVKENIIEAALQLGLERGIARESQLGLLWDVDSKKAEQIFLQDYCYKLACKQLGYPEDTMEALGFCYKESYELRGIEIKVSYSDFKNGICMTPEYCYVLAPKGIVPKEELPAKIGLLEFDIEKYQVGGMWQDSLAVAKRPKKVYDASFKKDRNGNPVFSYRLHAEVCKELVFNIAQKNTQEHIFWNPYTRVIKEGDAAAYWNMNYHFQIGDPTPFGLVCDRRTVLAPNSSRRGWRDKYIQKYKMVAAGKGMTKWMTLKEIQDADPDPSQS